MISNDNIEKTKNEIKKLLTNPKQKDPIIVLAQNDIYNRKILEYGKFNILLSPEKDRSKISIKKIDSGLNHVFAKIATKNKIAIGIDLNEITKLEKKPKAKRLAQIKRNIKICKKANTKISLLNYKDKINAQHFLMSLGASSKQAKEAIS